MKTSVILLLVFGSFISAQNNKYCNSIETYEETEANYLMGLTSQNNGLRISCAYHLGEMKSDRAVIPLIDMLKNSESQAEKLIAALSLIKIGNHHGIGAIKYQSMSAENERVKCLCKKFYDAFVTNKYPSSKLVVLEGDSEFISLVWKLGL